MQTLIIGNSNTNNGFIGLLSCSLSFQSRIETTMNPVSAWISAVVYDRFIVSFKAPVYSSENFDEKEQAFQHLYQCGIIRVTEAD